MASALWRSPLILRYSLLQVRDDDRQRAISARLGRVSVECVAEGGRPEPSLSLFAGGSNLTEVTGQGGR